MFIATNQGVTAHSAGLLDWEKGFESQLQTK